MSEFVACVHCKKRKAVQPYGLCHACYADHPTREVYKAQADAIEAAKHGKV